MEQKQKVETENLRMTLSELEREDKEKEKNYKIVNGDYLCKDCNSEIEAVTVIFSIHDSTFKMAGSGRTTKQVFPYCPTCENEPKISGIPITN